MNNAQAFMGPLTAAGPTPDDQPPDDLLQSRRQVRGQVCEPQIVEMYYKNHLGEDHQKWFNDGIEEVAVLLDWKNYGVAGPTDVAGEGLLSPKSEIELENLLIERPGLPAAYSTGINNGLTTGQVCRRIEDHVEEVEDDKPDNRLQSGWSTKQQSPE
ncbi:hypothetical protein PG984_002689 [Apiospora sp. TS-2023a]